MLIRTSKNINIGAPSGYSADTIYDVPELEGTNLVACGLASRPFPEDPILDQQAAQRRALGLTLDLRQFGAEGDGYTDDTAAIQAAIDYAVPRGLKIIAPAGAYVVGALTTPAGFKPLVLEGEGSPERSADNCGTRFVAAATIGANPILKIKGGSGRTSQGYVANILFSGLGAGSSGTGLLLEGVCGHRIINCAFEQLETAVQFKNASSGEFTEFCTVENCRATNVRYGLRYTRAAGNDSFHGTGAKGFTVSGTSGYAAVLIEGNGSGNPLIYNAPMEMTVFTATKIFEAANVSGAVNVYTHGALKIEREGAELITDTGGSNLLRVRHSGSINCLGQPANATGRFSADSWLFVCGSAVGGDGVNGQIVQTPRTYRARKTSVANLGTVSLVEVKPKYVPALLSVRTKRSNHERTTLLWYLPHPTSSGGYISVISTITVTDAAGVGTITFSVDASDNLVLTQANLDTLPVEVQVSAAAIFPGAGFPWHDQS